MKVLLIIAFLIVVQLSGLHLVHGQDNKQSLAPPSAPQTETLKLVLKSLNLTNPEKDVEINLNNGDLRFICICGYV